MQDNFGPHLNSKPVFGFGIRRSLCRDFQYRWRVASLTAPRAWPRQHDVRIGGGSQASEGTAPGCYGPAAIRNSASLSRMNWGRKSTPVSWSQSSQSKTSPRSLSWPAIGPFVFKKGASLGMAA